MEEATPSHGSAWPYILSRARAWDQPSLTRRVSYLNILLIISNTAPLKAFDGVL
jgi:hypothetical protein